MAQSIIAHSALMNAVIQLRELQKNGSSLMMACVITANVETRTVCASLSGGSRQSDETSQYTKGHYTMSNRLKAYVRRTMLQSARDYAGGKRRTAESTHSACIDALRGTDTGWWNDLIYIAPMLDMAHRYRRDIAMAFEEYRDATGGRYMFRDCSTGTETGADEILSALLRGPFDFEDYRGMNGDDADATLLGLRFAVEWYAGEVARDLCPDL